MTKSRTEIGAKQYRAFTFDKTENIDEEKRTIELSFSSDAEIRIWSDEVQILGHKDGEYNFDFLNDGAPLLLEHNRNNQIGVVEKAWVEGNKGRAIVRFSRSTLAQEIFQDFIDGIRSKISVGNYIESQYLLRSDEDYNTFYVDKWTSFEISVVSIPADNNVGSNRSANTENTKKAIKEETPMPDQVTGSVSEGEAGDVQTRGRAPAQVTTPSSDDVKTRALFETSQEILAIGAEYRSLEFANEYIQANKDKISVRSFQKQLLEKLHPESESYNANAALQQRASGDLDLSKRDNQRFSLVRAVRALINPNDRLAQQEAAYEYDVCHEAAKKAGYRSAGMFIPDEILHKRALNTGLSGAGASGDLIGESLLSGQLIPALVNQSAVMQYANIMNGLVGNVSIPIEGADPNAAWIDSETGSLPEGDTDFGKLLLSPKKLASFVTINSDLIYQSSLDVEHMVAMKIIRSIALKMDHTILYGSGASGEPLGIMNMNGLPIIPFAEDDPTYGEVVAMKGAIASQNAPTDALRYLASSNTLSTLESKQKFENANGDTIYNADNQTIAAKKVTESNQLDDNELLLGDFSRVNVARWGGVDMLADRYTGRYQDQIKISAIERMDCGVDHIQGFALGKKVA